MSESHVKSCTKEPMDNYESMIICAAAGTAEDYEDIAITVTEKQDECYDDLVPDIPERQKRNIDRKYLSLPFGLSSKKAFPFTKEKETNEKAKRTVSKDGLRGKFVKQMNKFKEKVHTKLGSSENDHHIKSPFHCKASPKVFRKKSEGHVAHSKNKDNLSQDNALQSPKIESQRRRMQSSLKVKTEDKVPETENLQTAKDESNMSTEDKQAVDTRDVLPNENEEDSEDVYLVPGNGVRPAETFSDFLARKNEKTNEILEKEGYCLSDEETNDHDEVYEVVCFKNETVMGKVSEDNEEIDSKTGDMSKPKCNNTNDIIKPPNEEKLEVQGFDITSMKLEDVKGVLLDLGLEKYVDVFEKEHIDGLILSKLSAEDFVSEFGMHKLEVIRLCEFIKSGHVPK